MSDYNNLQRELEFCQAELEERIQIIHKLMAAVQKHHAQRGNDKCWENDNELYAAFGLEPHGKNELPSYQEHKANCQRYRDGLYAVQMFVPREDSVSFFKEEQDEESVMLKTTMTLANVFRLVRDGWSLPNVAEKYDLNLEALQKVADTMARQFDEGPKRIIKTEPV